MEPLSVVEGKKKRLVLDLRHINKFPFIPKFHYEDVSSLSQVFAKDDWFFNWDLKSGYHHVNIYKPHQQYLGFSWVIDGVQPFFVFRVLPFEPQGDNSHRLGYRMCHFLRVLFWLKNKFFGLFYSLKLNFWVKILALNKFLGQIVMKH